MAAKNQQLRVNYWVIRNAHQKELGTAMCEHLDRMRWPREKILDLQEKKLRRLLKHAATHCVFYRERLSHAGLTVDNIDHLVTIDRVTGETSEAFQRIAPTTKDHVVTRWDDTIARDTEARKGLTKERAEKHYNQIRDADLGTTFYEDTELQIFATGGSSGRRGLFVWDRAANVQN